ncbi:MAG TPA: M56 family metallopeptidase [Gammaproteobacteria bacterium]|nr:M56 family metallopeptidase [Gammaproteobacteria bacterium]
MDIQAAVLVAGGVLGGTLAKGALLLAVAAAVSFCLRHRASAAVRHAVWHLAFVGLLVLPLVAALGPEFTLPGLQVATVSEAPAVQAAPSQQAAPAFTNTVALPAMADASANSIANAGPFADDAAPPIWLIALLLAWSLGAAALLARLGYGLMRIAQLSRRADPVDDPGWHALADEIAGQLGLRRKVALRHHTDVEMPMTFGIRRPLVLLPAAAAEWTDGKRRLVLLHELAHVRRGDALTQLVMQIVCALHWPNPLAWLGARRFLLTREQACDDHVLSAGARPSDYAGQLVEVARDLSRSSSFVPTPAMAAPSELKTRIQAILDDHRRRRALSRPGGWAMGALALAIVVPLAALRPAAAETAAAAVTQSAPPASTAEQAEVQRREARARAQVQRDVATAQRERVAARREEAAERRATAAAARASLRDRSDDPHTQIQKQAVFALSQLPAKESVPRLIEIAKSDANEAVRGDAVFWLGRIGNPKAVAFLNEFLTSNAPLALREKALFGISQLPKNSVPLLIKVAEQQDSDPGLREKAIFWLGQSHDPRAAEALMAIVQGHSK